MSNKNRSILVRIAVLVMLALAVLVISGCSQDNKTAAPAPTAEVTAAPAAEAPAAETVAETVEEKVEEVKEAVEEKAEEVTEAAAEAVGEAAAAVEEKVEEAKEAVEEKAEEVTEAAAEAVGEAAAAVEEKVEEAKEAVEEKAEEVTEAAAEVVGEAAAAVEEKVEEVKEAVEEKAEEVTEAAAETVEETAAAVEESVEAAAETVEEATVAEPTAAPAEPVLLVTVNGDKIYSDDSYLNAVISYYNDYAANYGYDTSSAEMINTINQYSLMYTMRSTLIRQKAAEFGLATLTDEEKAATEAKAKAEWAEIIESYVKESGTVTDASTDEEKAAARADAEAVFLAMGYDEARYVNDYLEGEAENMMTSRLQDRLTEGKTVTDADVQAYFDDLVKEDQETYEGNASTYEFYTQYYGQSSYYVPEGYRAITHILLTVDEELLNAWKDLSARLEEQQSAAEEEPVEESADATPAPDAEAAESATAEPTAEPVTPEMVAAAEKAILDSVQSTVDEIMAKYEGGTSFDDLIKEYGTDTGMKDDAKRAEGYMVHKDSILWDPAFTAAAMALEKAGDVSKPVVSQFGVHILQYLKDIPGGAVELTDDMKSQFRETLTGEMREEALSTALDEWMAASEIVYTEEGKAWKLPEAEAEEAAEETAAEEPAAEETANP